MANPRIGVIGLGAIGRTHIATWKSLGHTPVALADPIQGARETVAEQGSWQVYESGEELISSGNVDIVSICTPPAFHKGLVITALNAGKTVLCEKPLASTVADAEAIAAVAEKVPGQLHIGFCHRFEPAIIAIKKLIDTGALGTPITLRNRFAGVMDSPEKTWFANREISGGGALVDTSIHSIDIFRFLLGDAVEVRSLHSTQSSDLGPALDVEDTGVIILRNEAGALGVLESSWRTPPGEWSITVYGTAGQASFDYATGKGVFVNAEGEGSSLDFEPGDRFTAEFTHILSCWRNETEPAATATDGLIANQILEMAYADGG